MNNETQKTVLAIRDLKVDFETATGTVNAVRGACKRSAASPLAP